MIPLEFSTIDYGTVSKKLKRPITIEDSLITYSKSKRLTIDQVKKFVQAWNQATYEGSRKLKPKYTIDLYFKDGSKRTFKINGSINESKNYCFSISDKKFPQELWENSN